MNPDEAAAYQRVAAMLDARDAAIAAMPMDEDAFIQDLAEEVEQVEALRRKPNPTQEEIDIVKAHDASVVEFTKMSKEFDAQKRHRRRRRRHAKKSEPPTVPAEPAVAESKQAAEEAIEYVNADADAAAAAFEALTVGDGSMPSATVRTDMVIVDSLPGTDKPRILVALRNSLVMLNEKGLPRIPLFRGRTFKPNDYAVFAGADGDCMLVYFEDESTGLLARDPDGTEYVVAVPDFDRVRRAQKHVERVIEGTRTIVAVDPVCNPGERIKCIRPEFAASAEVAIAAFGNRVVVLRRGADRRWAYAAPAPDSELVGLLNTMQENHPCFMLTCVAAGGTDVAFAGLLGSQRAFLAAFDVDADGHMRTRAFHHWPFGARDPAKAELEPAAEEYLQPRMLATNGLGDVAACSPGHIVVYERGVARCIYAELDVAPQTKVLYTLDDICYAADGSAIFALASNGGVYRIADKRLRPVCTLNPRFMIFRRFRAAGPADKPVFSVY